VACERRSFKRCCTYSNLKTKVVSQVVYLKVVVNSITLLVGASSLFVVPVILINQKCYHCSSVVLESLTGRGTFSRTDL
jgi:hypothetical protein